MNKKENELDIRQAKLREIIIQTNKKLGKNTVKLAKDEPIKDRIAFDIPELDNLIGGGIELGSFSVIFGSKASGKSSLSYYLIGKAQKQGKVCFLFDLENSFNKERGEQLGIDLDKLMIGHFNNAEEAMDLFIKLTKEKVIDLIILDSIQALSPTGEKQTKKGKEKSVEDDTMALLARKLSQFFRMSANEVYKGKVGVLLIGQTRMDLGGFITLEKLSGGRALEHWASLILHIRRGAKANAPTEKVKEYYTDDKGKERYKTIQQVIGFETVIQIDKTKIKSEVEKSLIRIPFYFDGGFIKNKKEQEQGRIKLERMDHLEKGC